MALCEACLFFVKLIWLGPTNLFIKGLILFVMILVMILYEIFHRLMGLKFLRDEVFLRFGIKHIRVMFVIP